jgi:hypothetical protein
MALKTRFISEINAGEYPQTSGISKGTTWSPAMIM